MAVAVFSYFWDWCKDSLHVMNEFISVPWILANDSILVVKPDTESFMNIQKKFRVLKSSTRIHATPWMVEKRCTLSQETQGAVSYGIDVLNFLIAVFWAKNNYRR